MRPSTKRKKQTHCSPMSPSRPRASTEPRCSDSRSWEVGHESPRPESHHRSAAAAHAEHAGAQHQVRVGFKPATGRPTQLSPESVEGIPNGAVVRLKGDGTLDTAGARTLNNMIGTVEKRNGGYVIVAKSQLSPIDVLPLEG